MKIPENFKKKYNLIGESYSPENVEAALSELFSVSGRLYKENEALKAELAALQKEAVNTVPAAAAEIDLSPIEEKLAALAAKLDAVHNTVNDNLCVANDAAISAKKAEDAALEAKNASESAKESAAEALDLTDEVLVAVEALSSKIDEMEVDPVVYPIESVTEMLEAEKEDSAPEAPSDETPVQETVQVTAEENESSDIPELLPFILDENDAESEEEPAHEEPAYEEPAPEAPVIVPFFTQVTPEEPVQEEPEIEVIAESEPIEEVLPEAIPESMPEPIEEIAEEPIKEQIEEPDDEITEGFIVDVPAVEPEVAIADDLIRSAGLFDEPEEIEPAENIPDEDVSSRLSDMLAEEPVQEPIPEEKAAPKSFNDMKSALDAIRARLKK